MKILLALFLVAHGLIHASYVAPAPRAGDGPQWPFEMANSWLVSGLGLDVGPVKALGTALVVVVVVGFVAAGLSSIGLIVPEGWWAPLATTASIASIALLTLYFHPWLAIGFVIDALLLWAVFVGDWSPGALATP